MRENRLRGIWSEGGTVVNGWLQVPSSFSAEVMAHAGWDSLTIDMQHGPVDYGSLVPMLQAISTTDTVPVVRVPWNDPGLIMRVLDAGCYAVICPMINTREEAEAFVGACRYPPEGYRSYGPYRATLYGGQDYTDHANETVVTMAMIETQQALENLDANPGCRGPGRRLRRTLGPRPEPRVWSWHGPRRARGGRSYRQGTGRSTRARSRRRYLHRLSRVRLAHGRERFPVRHHLFGRAAYGRGGGRRHSRFRERVRVSWGRYAGSCRERWRERSISWRRERRR